MHLEIQFPAGEVEKARRRQFRRNALLPLPRREKVRASRKASPAFTASLCAASRRARWPSSPSAQAREALFGMDQQISQPGMRARFPSVRPAF